MYHPDGDGDLPFAVITFFGARKKRSQPLSCDDLNILDLINFYGVAACLHSRITSPIGPSL
jgi:hypothetical protein